MGAYRGPEDDELYEDDDEIKDKIAQARDSLDETTLEWLDAKFEKHKMGLQEQCGTPSLFKRQHLLVRVAWQDHWVNEGRRFPRGSPQLQP